MPNARAAFNCLLPPSPDQAPDGCRSFARRLRSGQTKIGENIMYKPFDLTGKVALVTGGNGGIGLGMADALAQAGADVVIWGTNAEKNDAAVKRLSSHGRKVMTQK